MMAEAEPEPKVQNVFGAIIFFSYIIAALFFTGLIVNDLFKMSSQRSARSASRDRQEIRLLSRKVSVMSSLAVLSFAVLSYHMLNFLILSYTAWARKEGIAIPSLRLGDLGGLHVVPFLFQIWEWAKSSTLFKDFAVVICNDPHRFWWTQQALSYSIAWNYFMSFQGRRLGIPRLWAYFVLDQILPLSFTQNLFLVAMYLKSESKETRGEQHALSVPSGPSPALQILPVVGYFVLVYSASLNVDRSLFLLIVLITRTLLFAPYLTIRPGKQSHHSRADESRKGVFGDHLWTVCSLAVGTLVLHVVQTSKITSLGAALSAIDDSPAVGALGYDYLLASASLIVYQGMESVW